MCELTTFPKQRETFFYTDDCFQKSGFQKYLLKGFNDSRFSSLLYDLGVHYQVVRAVPKGDEAGQCLTSRAFF